jgi:RNA polymerase sigma factor (sigma-70 family)
MSNKEKENAMVKPDEFLALQVKEYSDNVALEELISRHSGICYSIYNKFFSASKKDEALTIKENKDYIIYKAAQTFNPESGSKFSTWLGNMVRYSCLTVCSSKNRIGDDAVDPEVLSTMEVFNESKSEFDSKNENSFISESVRDLIEQSSDHNGKRVVMMRYYHPDGDTKTFKEISASLGVSVQTVVNWHNKFVKFLKNKLTSGETLDIL